MLVRAYLDTAKTLVSQYTGKPPLSVYLSGFFKQHKQYGSRDRKYIADLVYAYFRLGVQTILSTEQALLLGAWFKSRLPLRFFELAEPILAEQFEWPLIEKMAWAKTQYGLAFEPVCNLSAGISVSEYLTYCYTQSQVFLRLRQKDKVLRALTFHKIPFTDLDKDCIAVESNTDLSTFLDDRDYVIQDYASQRTGDFWDIKPNTAWWDCCAASGGKALRLLDSGIPIQLQVSDIRASILHNLDQRLSRYGYAKRYTTKVLDLTTSPPPQGPFDAIIADVPCSGSGTWARSPEGIYFTRAEDIQAYHEMQVHIACNAAQYLKSGGNFYYITCSVFALENEASVEAIIAQTGLQCVSQQVLHYPGTGSDCLFTAVLEKQ